MSVEILQEITEWQDESFNKNNGIYWVDNKVGLVAFQAPGKEKVVYKKSLKKFSKSRRKFKKLGEE